jgi:hypothetical protein
MPRTAEIKVDVMGLDEAKTLATHLALALKLLNRDLTHIPCQLVTHQDITSGATMAAVGSCTTHFHFSEDPCPTGAGQALLAHYGIRG